MEKKRGHQRLPAIASILLAAALIAGFYSPVLGVRAQESDAAPVEAVSETEGPEDGAAGGSDDGVPVDSPEEPAGPEKSAVQEEPGVSGVQGGVDDADDPDDATGSELDSDVSGSLAGVGYALDPEDFDEDALRMGSPLEGSPSVEIAFSNYSNNQPFTDFDSWDYYAVTMFTLHVSIMPKTGEDASGQAVVLQAPAGMVFTDVSGATSGIVGKTFTGDRRTVTIKLDDEYLAGNQATTIVTSLYLGGVSPTSSNAMPSAVAGYRGQYLQQGGVPDFTVRATYTQGPAELDSQSYTLKPVEYNDPGDSAFGTFGIYEYTSNPATGNRYEVPDVLVGRTGTLYRGTTTNSKMSSYYQLVLRQQADTMGNHFEPVWDVTGKLYLPDMITVAENLERYIVTDESGRYFLFGEEGYPGSTTSIYNNSYVYNVLDRNTVVLLRQNIGLRLREDVDPAAYSGQEFKMGLDVAYTTTSGSHTQSMDGLVFRFVEAKAVDWMLMALPANYQNGGFTLSQEKVAVADQYVTVQSASGVNAELHDNETHKGGTLTLENEGGYYIDALHYQTQHYGELSAVYYTSGAPGVAKQADIQANGEYQRTIAFNGQSAEDYVTKIVFTIEEGFARSFYHYTSDASRHFRFEMHGFSGLAPNQEDDEQFYYSALVMTLRGAEGCGEGRDTSASTPAVVDGAHTLRVPVKVSLQVQDVLTFTISGKSRNLFGTGVGEAHTAEQ